MAGLSRPPLSSGLRAFGNGTPGESAHARFRGAILGAAVARAREVFNTTGNRSICRAERA
jgi:hypothetical protein